MRDELLRPTEVMKMLAISDRRTLKKLVLEKKIICVMIRPTVWRYPLLEVEKFIKESKMIV